MQEKITQAAQGMRPGFVRAMAAAAGVAAAWWTGLPALAQALLVAQGADVVTGLLCAVTGRSEKTASGKLSSGALLTGLIKKGLEWLAVLVCVRAGAALGVESVGGAAMTTMMATELLSLIENLKLFGLNLPLLDAILDIASKGQNPGA